MVDYSDYNPAGTTRTTKRGIARHIPLLPNYFNHQWFEDYVTDFLQTNILENNGVISGCVITQDGGNDAINTSGGAVYINGNRVTVSASGPFSLTADGWYVSYVTSAGAIIHGYLENSTVQGAVTPVDSAIIGYTLLGNSVLYINSFFNDVSEFANQLIISFDQIIGTNAQVTTGDATVYYDSGTTSFKDKDDAVVVFNNGDKIKWIGLDALTAGIDINTIDYLDWAIEPGTTISLGSYDLDLGENQRGELDLSGTGTLTVLSSNGLRVKNSGITILNQAGDINIDNQRPSELSANIEYKNLVAKYISATTVDENVDSLKLLDENNNSLVINDIDLTYDIATVDRYGYPATNVKSSTWYERFVIAKPDGAVGKLLVPDIFGVADGTTAGKLIDSTATFLTDLVTAKAIVYNNTDKTKTRATINASAEGELTLDDDIFVSGESYTIQIILPTLPAGYTFRANTGGVYNDSGSDFDDFHQIDKDISGIKASVLASGTQGTYTSIDLSSVIPITAKSIDILVEVTEFTGVLDRITTSVAPVSTPLQETILLLEANVSGSGSDLIIQVKDNLNIIEKHTMYYKHGAGTNGTNIHVIGYKL